MKLPNAMQSQVERLRSYDANRPNVPGEHLAALGFGLALMLASGRSRSLVKRLLLGSVGGALIGRAASGRGGVARLASALDTRRRRF